MGIMRKGEQWAVVARVRDGKGRIKQRRGIAGTKEQAKALLAELKKAIREAKSDGACSLKSSMQTFGDAVNYYLERHDPGKSECCFDRLKAGLGNVALSEIGQRANAYFQNMRREISKTGRPYSGASINRHISWAKAALNLAVKHGFIDRNPIAFLEKQKEVPRDVILSKTDELRLMNVIEREAPHLGPIFRYSLRVPCRKSELVSMRIEDLDLLNGCIRVRAGTTKNGRGVYKPIPPDMIEYFRTLPKGTEYLFFREEKGRYLRLGDFKTAWKRCLRLAGLDWMRFHDTRHVSATALIDNGTPEQTVMKVAGWKTNMLRVYYGRDPKESLELVRFSPKCEPDVNQAKAAAG